MNGGKSDVVRGISDERDMLRVGAKVTDRVKMGKTVKE